MRLQRRIHLEQRKTHVDLQKEIRKRKEIEREIPAEDLEIIYVERERERYGAESESGLTRPGSDSRAALVLYADCDWREEEEYVSYAD